MFKKLKAIVAGETAADIEATIAGIEVEPIRLRLADARERRAAALLDGSSNAEVLAIEKEIDEARLDLERAEIQLGALDTRLVAAKVKERSAAYWKQHSEAIAARDAVIDKIDREYGKAAKMILALMEEGDAADRLVEAINREMNEFSSDQTHPSHERERITLKTVGDIFWGGRFYATNVSLRGTGLLPTSASPATGIFAEIPRDRQGKWASIAN